MLSTGTEDFVAEQVLISAQCCNLCSRFPSFQVGQMAALGLQQIQAQLQCKPIGSVWSTVVPIRRVMADNYLLVNADHRSVLGGGLLVTFAFSDCIVADRPLGI